jgi:hypothetical protein
MAVNEIHASKLLDCSGPFHHLSGEKKNIICRDYNVLSRSGLQMLLKLSVASSIVPSSLYLKRIVFTPFSEPISSGAHADVFGGEYEGNPVVLKRLRAFTQVTNPAKYHKVRTSFEF